MKFAQRLENSVTRFCRIKRKGSKNCRVIWLDNQVEELVSLASVSPCTAVEAGQVAPAVVEANPDTASPDPAKPERLLPLTGEEVCGLMRSYQVSTKDLAARLGIPTAAIREARSAGLEDLETSHKWLEVIQSPVELATT